MLDHDINDEFLRKLYEKTVRKIVGTKILITDEGQTIARNM